MRYSLAVADVRDCYKAGTDAGDFIAATIVDAVRHHHELMIGCCAGFDADARDDVTPSVKLR